VTIIFYPIFRTPLVDRFKDIVALICYFHVKTAIGKKKKKENKGGYIDGVLFPMLDQLQKCADENSFHKLSAAMFRKLADDKEDELSEYLKEWYFSDDWKNWFSGALPIVGVGRTNNPMEAFNRSIDQLVI